MSKRIKTIYALLFVALVLHPHFVDHIGPIARPYAQSLVILLLSGIAYAVYRLHQREIQKSRILQEGLRISEEKMVEAFTYLGSVNRRLPLLKQVSTDLLTESKTTKRGKKTVFDNLLAVAVNSIAQSHFGLLRFIEVNTGRTVKEFWHADREDASPLQRVGNRELLALREQAPNRKGTSGFNVVPTSDKEATVQGFLVLPLQNGGLKDQYSFLQALVDQSQLLYKYLFV